MLLILVQHGEAKSGAEDPERPLTEQGARAVEKTATWAERAGVLVAQIRHSGKLRAKQTAEIISEHLNPPGGTVAVEGMNPNDDVEMFARTLGEEHQTIALVGHLPFLSRLAGLLVTGNPALVPVRFENAGMVCLTVDAGEWSVQWAVPPRLMS